MKIGKLKFYGGAQAKICRLGLTNVFLELLELFLSIDFRLMDENDANDADQVGTMIRKQFSRFQDWVHPKFGDTYSVKRFRYKESFESRLGVEVQVSGRSDLLARDIVHIRNNLHDSHIDVGVIVVPSNDFEYRLTDRVANYNYAVRYVEKELREAQTYPIVLIGIEHDGYSDKPLPKKTTNKGKGKKTQQKSSGNEST